MKKILIVLSAILLFNGLHAQKIDRTKPPKAGPAPVISIKDPVQYQLKNGMTILVVEDHKLPKVTATLYIDQGPISEGDKAGVTSLMGQMLSEGTKSKPKAEFDTEVDQMGASLNLNSSGGSVSALTRYFDKAFMLMADAIKNPAMEESSFEKLKSQTLTGLKTIDKSAKAISTRVVNALSFGVAHPLGEFESEKTVENIQLADVKDAYKKYITPSRSYLTFIGDITPAQAKALAEKAFNSWSGNKLQLPKLEQVNNPAVTEIDLVDVPNAVQSEITVTNLVDLPMSHPDYFAVILANQILGGGSDARLFMNLREKHGFTYGSYSSIGSGRFQTSFKATASVRNDKVDSAVAEILKEIHTIRTEKVGEEELKNAKALYNGNFALNLENPATTARFASNILINGLSKDFYRTYLQKINAVTVNDVQKAAEKYFNYKNTRVVVVGKADVVKPELEKLGYPVHEFDKLAEPVVAQKREQADISADEVIAKYLQAIGGADNLKKINTMHSTGSMTIQGTKLQVDEKLMAPNLNKLSISMNGTEVIKNVYNGEKGIMSQMGRQIDYSEDQLKEKSDTKGLFNQLYYKDAGFKVEAEGVETVDDKKAYKLKITTPSNRTTTEWYDVNTGYLLKSVTSSDANGQAVEQTFEFSNYKKTGDIYLPYTIDLTVGSAAGSQQMEMQLDTITLNEGMKKEDFQ